MKIVLNKCFGGFGVSEEAYMLYAKKKGLTLYSYRQDFKHKGFIYNKSNESNGMFNSYFTKDMGDNVEINEEDYKKYNLYLDYEYRKDPVLIEVVEELGKKANGMCADLEVVEIPDNSFYKIDEYYGYETVYYSESKINTK